MKAIKAAVACVLLFSGAGQAQNTAVEINQQLKIQTYPTGTTRITGPGFDRTVRYEDRGDYGIMEGDIHIPLNKPVIATDGAEIAHGSTIGKGAEAHYYRWPDGKVHYRFASAVSKDVKAAVATAIAHIETRTYVEFIEIFDPLQYHVLITDDQEGCYSDVGYYGFPYSYQLLNLQRYYCERPSTAIHELLHTLGMWHEQSRSDRDEYITVFYQNIATENAHNFDKEENSTDIGAYDYDSIMHYSRFAFSVARGRPTILPKRPGVTFGRQEDMSAGDVITINTIYPEIIETDYSTLPAILNLLLHP